MNIKLKNLSLVITSISILLPLSLINAQNDSSISTNSKTILNTGLNLKNTPNVDIDASTTNSITDTGINVNSEGSNINVQSQINSDIDKSNIKSNAYDESGSIVFKINDFEKVSSENDLNVYVKNIKVEDNYIKDVEIDSDDTKNIEFNVEYKHTGKLFGFISVSMNSDTTVTVNEDSKIEVKSKLPWWNFLVLQKRYDKSYIENKIMNDTYINAHAKVNISNEEKAGIVAAMVMDIRSNQYADSK